MAGSAGYLYVARLGATAFTISKTLIQIKTGAAPIDILEVRLGQTTKAATELWNLQLSRWTAAATPGTVTAATPALVNASDPASLAVGGTAATGVNATVEPSGGAQAILLDTVWNILNGEWLYLPIPEQRIRIPQGGGLFTIKNLTTPAASTSLSGYVLYQEYV